MCKFTSFCVRFVFLGEIRFTHRIVALSIFHFALTIFNIFVGASAAYAMASAWWVSLIALVVLHQLIDAMDGTMARMYGLGSKFGAKLDEFTDIYFGTSLSVSACICVCACAML